MISNTPELITLTLSVKKIRHFLNNLPKMRGKLAEKQKMALAALDHLEMHYVTSIGSNETCTNKPTIPSVDDHSPCSDKPRIPELGDSEPCSSKPNIPDGF